MTNGATVTLASANTDYDLRVLLDAAGVRPTDGYFPHNCQQITIQNNPSNADGQLFIKSRAGGLMSTLPFVGDQYSARMNSNSLYTGDFILRTDTAGLKVSVTIHAR